MPGRDINLQETPLYFPFWEKGGDSSLGSVFSNIEAFSHHLRSAVNGTTVSPLQITVILWFLIPRPLLLPSPYKLPWEAAERKGKMMGGSQETRLSGVDSCHLCHREQPKCNGIPRLGVFCKVLRSCRHHDHHPIRTIITTIIPLMANNMEWYRKIPLTVASHLVTPTSLQRQILFTVTLQKSVLSVKGKKKIWGEKLLGPGLQVSAQPLLQLSVEFLFFFFF